MDEWQQQHLELADRPVLSAASSDTTPTEPSLQMLSSTRSRASRSASSEEIENVAAAKLAAEQLADPCACQAKQVVVARDPLENEGIRQNACDTRRLDVEAARCHALAADLVPIGVKELAGPSFMVPSGCRRLSATPQTPTLRLHTACPTAGRPLSLRQCPR